MSIKTIGFIGAGRIGKALAKKCVKAGYQVIMSNKQGVDVLQDYLEELGPRASAGTPTAAAAADVVFLVVRWASVTEALHGLSFSPGAIVVDTTNPILGDGTYVDLGATTSSEQIAAQLPGVRVVKAFNSLFAAWIEGEPTQPAGKRVVFVSGDDVPAKRQVQSLISTLGFAPIGLGTLKAGGLMQQAGKPLAALNLLLTA